MILHVVHFQMFTQNYAPSWTDVCRTHEAFLQLIQDIANIHCQVQIFKLQVSSWVHEETFGCKRKFMKTENSKYSSKDRSTEKETFEQAQFFFANFV